MSPPQHEPRQLLHGRYRVPVTIRERNVFELTIRHGARRFMAADEIDSIESSDADSVAEAEFQLLGPFRQV